MSARIWRSTAPAAFTHQQRQTIRLSNVPRTVIHADIVRLIRRLGIQQFSQVELGYNRFRPNGTAYITFNNAKAVEAALKQLRDAYLSTFPLIARSHSAGDVVNRRARGKAGREEASQRGIVVGTGRDAELPGERSMSVVLSGLPGRMSETSLRELLNGYHLRDAGRGSVVNTAPATTAAPSITSRFLVRLGSPSEAHRLVRDLHLTPLTTEMKEYEIQAHVVH